MARVVSWYERTGAAAPISCGHCGWVGPGAALIGVAIGDLFERSCPACFAHLEFACFPDDADIRAAAAAGDREALDAMPFVEQRAVRRELRVATAIDAFAPLPPAAHEWLHVEHDLACDFAPMLVVRSGDVELWREPAFWEDVDGARRLLGLLWSRFVGEIDGIVVSAAAREWFVGDDLGAGRLLDLAIARPRS